MWQDDPAEAAEDAFTALQDEWEIFPLLDGKVTCGLSELKFE